MKKYNWTINDLEHRLKLIKKLILTEKDPKVLENLKFDFNFLQDCIDNDYDFTQSKKLSLLENYENIKDDLYEIEFLWPSFQQFTSFTSPLYSPPLKLYNLSNDDLLSITHDFYKSLNNYYFIYFLKNFRERKNHIVFKNHITNRAGETISIISTKESFIKINRSYTLDDILTTIHEYSHATSALINPHHFHLEKTLYTEIDTLFMELIGADYITNLFKNRFNRIIKAQHFNNYYSIANDLTIMIDVIIGENKTEEGYKTINHLKEIALNEYGISGRKIDSTIQESKLLETNYLTSYMFAIELYNMYQIDKDKALYYLKKIIMLKNMSEKDYFDSILKMGIIPNQSISEFYEKTKNDALKLQRKKSNLRK